MKRYGKKFIALFLKWLLRFVALVLFLVILLLLLLQFPAVQTRVAGYAAREISNISDTEFSVDRVGIRLPGAVHLQGIYVGDHRGDTLLYASSLRIDMRIFALLKNRVVVDRLQLKGVTAKLVRYEQDTLFNYDLLFRALSEPRPDALVSTPSPEGKEDIPGQWITEAGDIRLKHVHVYYADHLQNLNMRVHLDELSARVDSTDMLRDIGLDHLVLKNMAFEYHDRNDFSLQLKEMDLHLQHVFFSADTLAVDLEHFSGMEAGGFSIEQLSANIALGRQNSIRDLYLKSRESLFDGDLTTSVPVLHAGELFAPHHTIGFDIRRALIGRDAAMVFPGLHMLFPDSLAPGISLQAKAGGTIRDLQLDSVSLEIPRRLNLNASGAVRGLPYLDSLFFDIPGLHFSGDPQQLVTYADIALPGELFLPGEVSLRGRFGGSPGDFRAAAQLDAGFATLAGSFELRQPGDAALPAWAGDISIAGENPLRFVGIDSLIHDLHAGFSVRGKGFDLAELELVLDGRIDSVSYNQYTFRSLDLDAEAGDGVALLLVRYHDEHLSFEANNELNYGAAYPEFSIDLALDHLNAQALGFTEDLIALQTRLSAEFKLKDPLFPEGWVHMVDTRVLVDREVFSLDSLKVVTVAEPGLYTARVSSPILQGDYRGNFPPMGIPSVLAGYLREYAEVDEQGAACSLDHNVFELTAAMYPSPYFTEIIFPFVDSFEPLSLDMRFNGQERLLSIDAGISEIHLMGFHLQNIQVRSDPVPSGIDFSVHVSGFEWDQVLLKNIRANGVLRTRQLGFDLSFDDRHNTSWFGVSGQMLFHEDHAAIYFDREMVLNREVWQIEPAHFLHMYADNIHAENLRIASQHKELTVLSSDPDDPGSPLELHFRQLDLSRFDLVDDAPLVEGVVHGSLIVSDIFARPVFLAGLQIDALGFQGTPIGDVSLQVDGPEPGFFLVEASIRGHGNRLDLSGNYRQDNGGLLDLQLRLDNLELTSLEALTFDQLTEMEGNISGGLHVTGPASNPDIVGSIDFSEVSFRLPLLNVVYRIPGETVLFDKQRIRFDHFTLVDRSGREASMNGEILWHDAPDIRADLTMTSGNFLFMDLPRGANDLFFGRLLIDTELAMRGGLENPVVAGRLKLNQGSGMSIILPQASPEAIGDEGVVKFVSPYDDLFADLIARPLEPQPLMSTFNKLDVSVNVEIDPATDVVIMIDEMAGDYLELTGGGLFSYGTDPGGRISLAGRYEIARGAYQMTFYDLIRRRFEMEAGSHIIWTGDPLDAVVDISARYTVRTSVRELMATHASDPGQQEGAFRQVYPFDVLLHMTGDLLTPEVRFELSLPPEHRGAMNGRLQARLNEINQNESELNKQVFALLIIGNFIQDDPLTAVTAGPGIAASARNSASRILSDQLNRLSDRYVRGVEIQFTLDSYEEIRNGDMVGRTELHMEVSRDFLDQRLRISAGGHLELEDETRRQLNPADIAGDFSVEYLLVPDGRWTLKGYRETKYEDPYDGEIVETGLSLIFRQTYNRFRNLFRPSGRSSAEGNDHDNTKTPDLDEAGNI